MSVHPLKTPTAQTLPPAQYSYLAKMIKTLDFTGSLHSGLKISYLATMMWSISIVDRFLGWPT